MLDLAYDRRLMLGYDVAV